jgi:hypothetical protein
MLLVSSCNTELTLSGDDTEKSKDSEHPQQSSGSEETEESIESFVSLPFIPLE